MLFRRKVPQAIQADEIAVNQALTATTEKDSTPLIVASYLGNFTCVAMLLDHKDINTSLCYENKKALEWAQPDIRTGGLRFPECIKISEKGRRKVVHLLQQHATK